MTMRSCLLGTWRYNFQPSTPTQRPWALQCTVLQGGQTDGRTDAKNRSHCTQYDRLKSFDLHRRFGKVNSDSYYISQPEHRYLLTNRTKLSKAWERALQLLYGSDTCRIMLKLKAGNFFHPSLNWWPRSGRFCANFHMNRILSKVRW